VGDGPSGLWGGPTGPVDHGQRQRRLFKPFSFRSLTATYLAALLIIASLSISSHFVLSTTLRDTEGTSAVINMAGRQRMLSQRIASLAAQRQLGDKYVDDDLSKAATAFEEAHRQLSGPYIAVGTAPGAEELHSLYFTGPAPLDAMVHDFVATARALLKLTPGDAAAAPLTARLFAEARAPLLDALNEATSIQQREGERRVAHLEWLQSAILIVVLVTLVLEALVIFRPMITRIMRQLSEILKLATTDSLTEVANRRSFLDRGEVERERAIQYGGPLSVLLLDVDHFKRVNDTYGHAAGDAVLRTLSETVRRSARKTDLVGRLGGEEFAVLLPRTGVAAAQELAERIRLGVASTLVRVGTESLAVTVSIGVATMAGPAEPVEAMLRRADLLMYDAKVGGRNRVVAEA
jgi:diguanylate cyclase (GGDEF)-like protein